MPFFGWTLHMISSLHNRHIQILKKHHKTKPYYHQNPRKPNSLFFLNQSKTQKEPTKNLPKGHLKITINMSKSNFCVVFNSTIGLSPSLKRPHFFIYPVAAEIASPVAPPSEPAILVQWLDHQEERERKEKGLACVVCVMRWI